MSKETVVKLGIRSVLVILLAVTGWLVAENKSLASKVEGKLSTEQYRYDLKRIDGRLVRIEAKVDILLGRD